MQQTAIKKDLSQSDFRKFCELIYQRSGIFLDEDKHTLLQSRLQKRLRATGCVTYSDYLDHIQQHDPEGDELQNMINRVTTNKTHFFREEHHFDYLRDVVFPSLIDQAKRGERKKRLRIWSAACSSGEEPYSIAMTIEETFCNHPGWDIRILASDIDTKILDEARTGIYHEQCVEDLDPSRIRRHFLKGKGNSDKVKVRPHLQDMITFKQINFAEPEWPLNAKFDAIFCRNVLIYFDEATQDRLVRRFVNFMHPDAHMFIGHSESLNRTADLYRRCGNTVFQLTEGVRQQLASAANTNQPPPATANSGTYPLGPSTNRSALNNVNTKAETRIRSVPEIPNESQSGTAPDIFQTATTQSIIVGEICTAEEPTILTTTVGSCIATCLYDEISCVGGMNHFALPSESGSDRLKTSFGVHAMEVLINALLNMGAARHRLKAKVFGAGRVSKQLTRVGNRNEEFVRHFLSIENIPIAAELLGGESGMMVQFEPTSARVRVHLLTSMDAIHEDHHLETMQLPAADVTLF